MQSAIFFVKQESGLFRKGKWNVLLDKTLIGIHPEKESALSSAVGEADRTSYMGRQSEVWVFEGDGFVLFKAFTPQKPQDEAKGVKGKRRDQEDDAAFIDADPSFDGTAYAGDATTDSTSYTGDTTADDPTDDAGGSY
jgi:hypothetical protein